ncbi:hypothetical protein KY285_022200 [Solanum tuberosum]|nr:hypothetical protein KY285_022200 [Solanum tuberosum]
MSFLLWRALRYKLPTNEILAAFGVEPVKCFCCLKQGWDEVDHIFIQGHFAGKNVAHTTIIKTLPIVICWNLWKNRCSAKYGGKLPGSWPEVVDCIAKCNQDIRITLVMWKTPPTNKYKLNTDGSALHNPGKIGGGGILRDDQGVIIYAFAVPFGEGTNNQVEVQAACYGLNWCIQHGYNNILLEVDSELLTKWLLQVSIPWRMHREANSTADLLAKHSHQNDIEQHYYTPQQLPHAVKGSYLLEKMGVHNFRRKKLKRIKQPP